LREGNKSGYQCISSNTSEEMRQPIEKDLGRNKRGGNTTRRDSFTVVKERKPSNMGEGKPFFPVEIGGLINPFPTKKGE
jgi:hypothetical protein